MCTTDERKDLEGSVAYAAVKKIYFDKTQRKGRLGGPG